MDCIDTTNILHPFQILYLKKNHKCTGNPVKILIKNIKLLKIISSWNYSCFCKTVNH